MVMMMHILTMHHLLVEEKILEAVMDGLGDQDQIGEVVLTQIKQLYNYG
jgi:hypothetical protein